MRQDGRDLPGVVRLVAADRHEGVRAGREDVRDDVLQLAGLVAAVGESRADVLALGPHLRATEMGVRAGRILLGHLQGDPPGERVVDLGFAVVERASA